MKFLGMLDDIISIAESSGWPVSHKALYSLRAQAMFDLAPVIEKMQWPRIEAMPAPAEELE